MTPSENEKQKLKQKSIVSSAKGLANYFAVDIVIRIFNQVIWEYHFPPKN